jgi:hypothetical protein
MRALFRLTGAPLALALASCDVQMRATTPAEFTANPDITAARSISVLIPLPLAAHCGDAVDVRLASATPRAHGTLVIDTDDPGLRQWKTEIGFAPK